MKIEINTQSSIKLIGDKIIYFDPYLITEEYHDADYIFITHDHYDHLDPESIYHASNSKTKFIIPDSIVTNFFTMKINMHNVTGVKPNEDYVIDNIPITTIPSYNLTKQYHPRSKDYVGYIVTLQNKKYYIAGDTDLTKEAQDVKCDIAFLPIGGTFTMDYQEAAKLTNIIKPQVVIPIHYDSIVGSKEDANRFKSLVSPSIQVLVLLN